MQAALRTNQTESQNQQPLARDGHESTPLPPTSLERLTMSSLGTARSLLLTGDPVESPSRSLEINSDVEYFSNTDSDDNDSDHTPSLDEDADVGEDDNPISPTLESMGERHARNNRVKAAQSQLGLSVPTTTRGRIFSDPLRRNADGQTKVAEDTPDSKSNLLEPSPPSQQQPAVVGERHTTMDIPWSPAMAFLAGLNSPFSVPRTLSPIESALPPPPKEEPVDRIGPYTLGPVIAHGGFSVIRKATASSGVVAVKIISRPPSHPTTELKEEFEASLENEIAIWSSLHHEFILPLFSTYRKEDSIYLVSLYCPAGSLFDLLRLHGAPGLPQDDVGTMFRQIVRGLRYLHEQMNLVHGDIKLENVLVDELGACRITDFGLARYIVNVPPSDTEDNYNHQPSIPPHLRGRQAHHRNSSHVPGFARPASLHHFPPGSLPYASPELLLPPAQPAQLSRVKGGDTKSDRFPANPAQDIWALGCLLHALIFGRLPFVDSYEPRLQMKIVRGVWERDRSRTRSRAPGSRSKSRGPHTTSRDTRQRSRSRPMTKARSKSSSPDVKVGRGVKRVLRGCICVDIRRRWTIAQVDEVRQLTSEEISHFYILINQVLPSGCMECRLG